MVQVQTARFGDKSGFLSVYNDGTNWIGIEPSDLTLATLPSTVTGDPLATLSQIFSGSVAIPAKGVGLLFGVDNTFNGFTGAADQPSAFGTITLHDNRVFWSNIETSQGVYDPTAVARLDTLMNAAYTAGKDILVPVYTTPLWASGQANVNYPPTNMAYVTSYVNWLLNRYGDKITALVGWNEPNVATTWLGGNMTQLVAYQKAIYQAVKTWNTANGKNVKVASPQFTFRSGVNQDTLNLDAYMAAAYADSGNANYYCDVIAFHPYTKTSALHFDRNSIDSFLSIVQARPNTSGLELWCTEIGDSMASARTCIEMMAYCFAKGFKKVIFYSWYLFGNLGGDMSLYQRVGKAKMDEIAAMFQGKTMTALNSYRTININSGGSSQWYGGGQLGAVLDGQGVILT